MPVSVWREDNIVAAFSRCSVCGVGDACDAQPALCIVIRQHSHRERHIFEDLVVGIVSGAAGGLGAASPFSGIIKNTAVAATAGALALLSRITLGGAFAAFTTMRVPANVIWTAGESPRLSATRCQRKNVHNGE